LVYVATILQRKQSHHHVWGGGAAAGLTEPGISSLLQVGWIILVDSFTISTKQISGSF
jgi:hypothetical protein